ncbi:MAG: nucleotide exchange factor GrpE [Bacteroidetes bacterium]|jgi:molecular chaperone GrpE|nr:nucleotide exchange factor GrpE [Bacteroidota bacterium]
MAQSDKKDNKKDTTQTAHLDPEEQKRAENHNKEESNKKKDKKADKPADEEVSKDKFDELNNKFMRLAAEFDNFKKRTARERVDLLQNAARDTIADLLPILDDFDRAKKLSEDESSDESFSEGVELVYQKLHSTLKKNGLKTMDSDGKVFDAELHEALTEVPAPSEDLKGKVVDTIEKGYLLNDKIIRHAKVVVGK